MARDRDSERDIETQGQREQREREIRQTLKKKHQRLDKNGRPGLVLSL